MPLVQGPCCFAALATPPLQAAPLPPGNTSINANNANVASDPRVSQFSNLLAQLSLESPAAQIPASSGADRALLDQSPPLRVQPPLASDHVLVELHKLVVAVRASSLGGAALYQSFFSVFRTLLTARCMPWLQPRPAGAAEAPPQHALRLAVIQALQLPPAPTSAGGSSSASAATNGIDIFLPDVCELMLHVLRTDNEECGLAAVRVLASLARVRPALTGPFGLTLHIISLSNTLAGLAFAQPATQTFSA